MASLEQEYQENQYILYKLSQCIEMCSNYELLTKLYELKHWVINEQEKIDDFFYTQNEIKGE